MIWRFLHDWLCLYSGYFYNGYSQADAAMQSILDYFNGVRG